MRVKQREYNWCGRVGMRAQKRQRAMRTSNERVDKQIQAANSRILVVKKKVGAKR